MEAISFYYCLTMCVVLTSERLGLKLLQKLNVFGGRVTEISGSPIDAKLFLLIFKTWRHTGCGNMTYHFRYP